MEMVALSSRSPLLYFLSSSCMAWYFLYISVIEPSSPIFLLPDLLAELLSSSSSSSESSSSSLSAGLGLVPPAVAPYLTGGLLAFAFKS